MFEIILQKIHDLPQILDFYKISTPVCWEILLHLFYNEGS